MIKLEQLWVFFLFFLAGCFCSSTLWLDGTSPGYRALLLVGAVVIMVLGFAIAAEENDKD